MALLAALCAVIGSGVGSASSVLTERLFCLHVEHGLRPAEESKGDAGYVRDFCKTLGVSCRVESVPQGKIASYARRRGIGIEAAARFFRRRALLKEAARLGDNTFILTAHTKDDALELALMRVLRGAGPAGLAAMPVRKGQFIRPLLFIDRADVIDYLMEKKISWREDSTNTDERFLRNRVRRRLVPLLNEFFPSWKNGLSGMAATQSLAADFICAETQCRVTWNTKNNLPRRTRSLTEEGNRILIKTPCNSVSSPCDSVVDLSLLYIDEENFFAHPRIIREEALFQAVDRFFPGGKSSVPKRSVIRRFCAGELTAADLGPVRVRRKGKKIALSLKRNDFSETGFSLLIKEPGLYNLNRISVEVCPFSAQDGNGVFFSCLPLVFRRSFSGDFLVSRGKKIRKRDLSRSRLVSAADRFGTAAFVGPQGLLFARDTPSESGGEIYRVTVKMTDEQERG